MSARGSSAALLAPPSPFEPVVADDGRPSDEPMLADALATVETGDTTARAETPEQTIARLKALGKERRLTDEEKDERMQAHLALLASHQQRLATDPEAQRQWLASLPHIHQYSLANVWLVKLQCPEATRVQSASAWKKEGRHLRKGTSGIFILRPVTRTVTLTDPETGEAVLDAKGKPVKVKVKTGKFVGAHTYDISQTEPFKDTEPSPEPERAQGADAAIRELCAVAQRRGVTVLRGGGDDIGAQFALLTKQNAGGYYDVENKRIVTRAGLTPEQEARVLAHELGHAELHTDEGYRDLEDRRMKEVEAEGVAFALCSAYGIESDYSGHYISHWADGDTNRFKAALETIHRGAKRLLTDIDELRAEQQQETAAA